MKTEKHVPVELLRKYNVPEELIKRFYFYNYNHALELLTQAFQPEWEEIIESLLKFDITIDELRESGGNQTQIPKKFDNILYPYGWREIRISGDLRIGLYPRQEKQRKGFAKEPVEEYIMEGYIDGHNIDFLKNRVAFDLEWNSKDQTFDRDLLAMRTYYDCNVISVGIIVTREKELNDVFRTIYDCNSKNEWKSIQRKYGASTTWIGKLNTRLDSRRNGGCPILAVGIRKSCVVDWSEGYVDENKPKEI